MFGAFVNIKLKHYRDLVEHKYTSGPQGRRLKLI